MAWAKRDRVLQLRRSLPAIRRIRDVRVELFRGGHAPFLECPDEFARVLGRFLDELEERPATVPAAGVGLRTAAR